jgi:hypothetical protein
LTFSKVLVDESKLALLEIAKAAVHHLGGFRTGARSNVAAIDKRNAKSSRRRVKCDAGARHSRADDDEVVGRGGEGPEHAVALEGGHGSMLAQARVYLE